MPSVAWHVFTYVIQCQNQIEAYYFDSQSITIVEQFDLTELLSLEQM